MIDIIAYEMIYTGNKIDEELCIEMAPFSEEIYEEYEKIYNIYRLFACDALGVQL